MYDTKKKQESINKNKPSSAVKTFFVPSFIFKIKSSWGERRDLNPRPLDPQTSALPTELRPPYIKYMK